MTLSRSEHMGRIKAKGNKSTELKLRMLLVRKRRKGWVVHPKLEEKPDIAFPKSKIAIFVDGCFWHGCPKCGHIPKTNSLYWKNKIRGNQLRDRRRSRTLRKSGWSVIRIWEHEFNNLDKVTAKLP